MHFIELLAHLQSLLTAYEGGEGPLPDKTGAAITLTTSCHKELIGRVIGRDGATIKAIQIVTGAALQVDQGKNPCVICISGCPMAVSTANAMIKDIQTGVFSGFVLLRTVAALLDHPVVKAEGLIAVSTTLLLSQLPFYVPKLGFIDRDVAEGLGLVRPFAMLRFSVPFNIKCVPAVFLDPGLLIPTFADTPAFRLSHKFILTFHSWVRERGTIASLNGLRLQPAEHEHGVAPATAECPGATREDITPGSNLLDLSLSSESDFSPWARFRDTTGRALFRNRITGELCEPVGSPSSGTSHAGDRKWGTAAAVICNC